MHRRMLPLNSLRAFEATGLNRSFTRAAEQLGVTQSAVSRHVINLEQLLGISLLDRQPHRLALTEAGLALLPAVSRAFDEIDRALSRITAAPAEIALRVALPPTFAHQLAVPLLREFRRALPELALDLDTLPAVEAADLARYDLAVVYTEPRVTDLVMDLLWMETVTPLCHPALLPAGELDAGRFLAANQLLHIKVGGSRYGAWERWLAGAGLPGLDVRRGLVFDTSQLAVQYALNGEGVVATDPELFRAELAEGRLVAPFARAVRSGFAYYLALRPDDLQNTPAQLFRSWLLQHFMREAADR
jgi:DNA-binding transcriptional LysR family regulator